MRFPFFIIAIIIAASCAFNVASGHADIYRYNDKDGVEHITNDFTKIPPEYQEQFLDKSEPKKSNEVINAKKELAAAVAADKTARAGTAARNAKKDGGPQTLLERLIAYADRYDARLPLQIAGAIAAVIAIFIGGSYVGAALGNKKLAAFICFALAAFVLAYLVSVNLQRVSDSYHDIIGKVKQVETKLNSKQKTPEQQMELTQEHNDENADAQRISPVKLPD